MGLWYRRRYNLPPNHPLYLDLSSQEIAAEYWAHHFDDLLRSGKSIETIEDDDFDLDDVVASMSSEDDWETIIDDGSTDTS